MIQMKDDINVLIDLLTEVLGKPKKHYESQGQISFDCPVCSQEKGLDGGDGKGNLEVSYAKHVYKCWACGDLYSTQGHLGKLFDKFGTKKQKKVYNLIRPEEFSPKEVKKTILRLPEGYTQFKDSNPRFIPHIEAYKYLKSRGISDSMIEKYKIGYTVSGDFAYRIIIPSFNLNGELNYFVARSWVPKKLKYKNPTVPKDEIIFNEGLIDWKKDIYLCEGVFDSFFLDNSIVMLGKKMSKLLFETIYEKSEGNIIICLDGDAFLDGLRLYNELNGGRLYNKIKIIKLPKDKDVCDLKGEIDEYYYEIK
jgi:DNA primase